MKNENEFNLSLKYFYESLSNSIKGKKESIGVTRNRIMPSDPNRVTQVTKNKRNKSYPYLIGVSELFRFNKLYKYESKDEWDEADFDGKEFEDDYNYDEMLWGHINWMELYSYVIEDIKNMDSSSKISKLFFYSLLDYVPYAIDRANLDNGENNPYSTFFEYEDPVDYLLYKRDIEDEANQNDTGITKNDITCDFYGIDKVFYEFDQHYTKAIEWVYFTKKNIPKVKELFLEKFKGGNLSKFDKNFNEIMNDIMLKIVEESQPTTSSLGLQAYNYMNEILNSELLKDEGGFWYTERTMEYEGDNGFIEEKRDIYDDKYMYIVENYLSYAKSHLEKLAEFQEEFKKAADEAVNRS